MVCERAHDALKGTKSDSDYRSNRMAQSQTKMPFGLGSPWLA